MWKNFINTAIGKLLSPPAIKLLSEGRLWSHNNSKKANAQFILINKKWINSALNSEKYSSFEGVPPDHRIVLAKIHSFILFRNKKTNCPNHMLSRVLTSRGINNKYMVIIRNKFDTLQEISERHTPKDKYENFVTTRKEVATECIPT